MKKKELENRIQKLELEVSILKNNVEYLMTLQTPYITQPVISPYNPYSNPIITYTVVDNKVEHKYE